jgi:FixJ family two-component response regulator
MSRRKMIVVVVDDDPSMLKAMETLLDAHGFGTLLFASAEEFLAQEAAPQAKCLLLDIDLGSTSGIELYKQVKNSGSRLPAIFMTGLEDECVRTQAIGAGGVAFLRKPFSARQLIDAIEKSIA